MTLYDADGKELAFADDYRFHPDPVLFFKVPKDGLYKFKIKYDNQARLWIDGLKIIDVWYQGGGWSHARATLTAGWKSIRLLT